MVLGSRGLSTREDRRIYTLYRDCALEELVCPEDYCYWALNQTIHLTEAQVGDVVSAGKVAWLVRHQPGRTETRQTPTLQSLPMRSLLPSFPPCFMLLGSWMSARRSLTPRLHELELRSPKQPSLDP